VEKPAIFYWQVDEEESVYTHYQYLKQYIGQAVGSKIRNNMVDPESL
jgi:hypothetical protein